MSFTGPGLSSRNDRGSARMRASTSARCAASPTRKRHPSRPGSTSSAMPPVLGAVFFLGLLAAAFSSADSALASLTTAFCVDFLELEGEGSTTTRNQVYVAFMAVILAVMFGIYQLQEETIISTLFTAAGYTYGPLLGLFALALTTNRTISHWGVLAIAIAAPLLSYGLSLWAPTLGYTIGFELLLYNGAITYVGAWLISQAPSRS